jgi:hypothetical protein
MGTEQAKTAIKKQYSATEINKKPVPCRKYENHEDGWQ